MDEENVVELKRKINEFIWQHGHADMTLDAAERAAKIFLELLAPGAVPEFQGSCTPVLE